MNSLSAPITLRLNAYDPADGDSPLAGEVDPKAAETKEFALARIPQGLRTSLAARPPANVADPTDPEVGWGLVVSETLTTLPKPIKELVSARKAPVFRYRPNWQHAFTYLHDSRHGSLVEIVGSPRGTAATSLPYYLMIYGGPSDVPWRLQFLLSAGRCVGRLALEGEALSNYVGALLSDFADEPADPYTTLTWAVDWGEKDITRIMRTHIALAAHSEFTQDREIGRNAHFVDGMAGGATRERLQQDLVQYRPGMIVTTSHGQTGPTNDHAEMRRTLGLPVDEAKRALEIDKLLAAWQPAGAIWYCHACCSAGSEAPSAMSGVFPPLSKVRMHLDAVAKLGAMIAPLPTQLLGARRPLRAFIGHVEPTSEWVLQSPGNGQPVTDSLVRALHRNLYQAPPPRHPVGLAFRDWYAQLAALYSTWDNMYAAYKGAADVPGLLWHQLRARDVQSLVILGDPAAALPLRPVSSTQPSPSAAVHV